jgi:pantoate--beta-alanine ligase
VKIVKEFENLESRSIGFVPTMGALHDGHRELLKRGRAENELLVLSIFVNPTQFLEGEDFSKYPRTLEEDIKIAKEIGVDILFLPDVETLYSGDEVSILAPKIRGFILEGKGRVGHFNGVLQVVLKLFNIVKPHKAYFGKKDAQQLILIESMVKNLFLDIEIVPVDIVRDFDGVALSSRNRYLSKEERKLAIKIPKALTTGETLLKSGNSLQSTKRAMLSALEDLEIGYVEIRDRNLNLLQKFEKENTIILIAVKVGKTRLIDNIWL